MLIAELVIDVGDAMGANITNTMCEAVSPAPRRDNRRQGRTKNTLNYSVQRVARATATFHRSMVGADVIPDMILAYEFADNDVYRAVTHNKG